MNIANLGNIMKVFGGGEPDPQERQRLVKEAVLMTLARASNADADIQPVEVATVRRIVKRITGEDVSEADVRVAAHSELFETTPLDRCLARIRDRLDPRERVTIAQGLAEVIRSDVRVTDREVQFFERVAKALKITAAQLAGLVPDNP
jgi:uncharacterized tellurite resistance protein B-like protein